MRWYFECLFSGFQTTKKKSKENYQCGCSSSGDHLYFEIYVAFYYCKKKFLNKGMLKMSGREGKAITTTTTTTTTYMLNDKEKK